ncbi:MAG: hypothetical protein ACO2ZM_08170, partial [Francisellaceae bacterium]
NWKIFRHEKKEVILRAFPESLYYAVGNYFIDENIIDPDRRSTWTASITLDSCGTTQGADANIINLTDDELLNVSSNSTVLLPEGSDSLTGQPINAFGKLVLHSDENTLPENYKFSFEVKAENQLHHYDVDVAFIGDDKHCTITPAEYYCDPPDGNEQRADVLIYKSPVELMRFKQNLIQIH